MNRPLYRLARATSNLSLIGIVLLAACAEAPPEGVPQEEVEVTLWAQQPMLKNPVGLTHDPQGRIYVTETARRASADLDVRRMGGLQPTPWAVLDWKVQSVDERRELIRRVLAPGSTFNNPWMTDRDGDGSADWRDLTTISERIHVLEDTDGDGTADTSHVFAEEFHTEITGVAGGVLWHENGVYFTLIPDLWRLQDTDGDGRADERQSLLSGLGVHIGQGGHDMHGLIVGPDGKIYWTIGDKGISTTTPDGRRFHYPNQGVLMRANPDGSEFEVVAHGLRNCQEVSFDDYGNWFCVDNDGDFEGERERLVYLAEGSDTGWRINWQFSRTNQWAREQGLPEYNPWMEERLFVPKFEGQAAYITPALANYSVGPCGFAYNPGTALSEAYKGYFFLTQFPVKLLTAFQVRPKGAGFEMVNEHTVYEGEMATGLNFGPDGALYVADWRGGWELNEEGAIHRLDIKGAADRAIRRETQQLIREGMGGRADEALVDLLGHADQRVRLQAQFELARRGNGAALVETAFDPGAPQLARVHALWGMGQLVRSGEWTPDRPMTALVEDDDLEIRAQAAKFIGVLKPAEADALLVPMLEDASPRVQYHAAMALGKAGLGRGAAQLEAFDALVDLLARNDNDDAFLRHAAVIGLVGLGAAEPVVGLAGHASAAVRLAAVVALRRLESPLVARFLDDADEYVVTEAARAIHDDLSIPDALPALAALIEALTFENEALLRRVLSANFRLGTPAHAEAVLAFALDDTRPDTMRAEALQALATWTNPPMLDRVDRRYRPELEEDRPDVRPILASRETELMALEQEAVQVAALQTLRAHNLQPDGLAERLADTDRPLAVRLEALQSILEAGRVDQRDRALRLALEGDDEELRLQALDRIVETSPELALRQIRALLAGDAAESVKQQALRNLARIQRPEAVALLDAWLDRLAADDVPPALRLDVVEAADASRDPALTARLADLGLAADSSHFALALEGGDAARGRDLFINHVEAQCVRCHQIGEEAEGGVVGPNLQGMGRRADRPYLLESLLYPSARIAEGFQSATLTLASGEVVSGHVVATDDEALEVRVPTGEVQRIPRTSITQQADHPVSTMPPMGDILTPREVRDLIEYMSGL